MKKSILIYLGGAVVVALVIVLFGPYGGSPSHPEGEFFVLEREVPFFRGHGSPVLEQKFFEVFTEPNGKEYFTTINRERTGIDVQPLDGSQHFTIRLDSFYGPDSIKLSFDLLYCYKIVSWDSIFLIDRSGTRVFMADKEGSISTHWTVSDTICEPTRFQLRGFQFSTINYLDSSLYATYLPFFNTPEEIFSCDAVAKIPLRTGRDSVNIERIFGPYPDVYTRQSYSFGATGYLGSMTRITTSPTPAFVISFPKDHNMYRIDEYGTEVAIPAKSSAIRKFTPFTGNLIDNMDNVRYESEEPRYWKVMYDPYRKQYYRIALHRQEFKDADGRNRALHQKPWSIMVFDENFSKLGEQNFEAKQFFPMDVFVGKEGLYVSNATVVDETGKPSLSLSFSLFKVKIPSL